MIYVDRLFGRIPDLIKIETMEETPIQSVMRCTFASGAVKSVTITKKEVHDDYNTACNAANELCSHHGKSMRREIVFERLLVERLEQKINSIHDGD